MEPMDFYTNWLAVIVVGFLAVASPGPDFAITIRNSLVFSRRAGLFTALGIAMGLNFHIAYSLVGIGVLISQSVWLFNVVKWIGAAYLIWVGIGAIRAGKTEFKTEEGVPGPQITAWGAWRVGFLTNLLNPKAPLFFLALYTQVIQPGTPLGAQSIYGFTILAEALVWFSLVALLVSHQAVRGRLIAVSHWVERIFGVAFIALGLKLALTRAN